MSKYCILYSYFETDESIKRLSFFINQGLIIDDDIFYVFLINNYKCSINIPAKKNILILPRENIGHDFGSWKYGLQHINSDTFDYFIFMNDTIMGPFLPKYIPKKMKWYQMFCLLLSNKVKLSGLTINYVPKKHVQSMMFCTDKVGFNILTKTIFNTSISNMNSIYKKDRIEFIITFEVNMSEHIINNGYLIDALFINNNYTDDPWYNNKYYNSTINPFETMFIKKNRIDSDIIDLYITNKDNNGPLNKKLNVTNKDNNGPLNKKLNVGLIFVIIILLVTTLILLFYIKS